MLKDSVAILDLAWLMVSSAVDPEKIAERRQYSKGPHIIECNLMIGGVADET